MYQRKWTAGRASSPSTAESVLNLPIQKDRLRRWDQHHDLLKSLNILHKKNYKLIAETFTLQTGQHRTENQVKTQLRKLVPEDFPTRNLWTQEEDDSLVALVKA